MVTFIGGAMSFRYFGRVKAQIFSKEKKIVLSYSLQGKQPLGESHKARCLSWALNTMLEEYPDFVLTVPEPEQSFLEVAHGA